MSNEPFAIPPAATVKLAATDATGRVAISTVQGHQIRIHNAGSSSVFVAFGDVTIVGSLTTSVPIPAGDIEVFTIPLGTTYVAGICNTGETTNVYFTRSNGF